MAKAIDHVGHAIGEAPQHLRQGQRDHQKAEAGRAQRDDAEESRHCGGPGNRDEGGRRMSKPVSAGH
jgi:hypothetical protein